MIRNKSKQLKLLQGRVTVRKENLPMRTRRLFTPGMLIFLCGGALPLSQPSPAQADPFELIVPSALTVNTGVGIGVSGNIASGWLVATTVPLDFSEVDSPSIAPGSSSSARSDTIGVGSSVFLIVYPPAITLMPGEVAALGDKTEITGLDLFAAEVLPSEQVLFYPSTGFYMAGEILWPERGFTGSANIDYLFALGQDVARYSVDVTFVESAEFLVRVDSAQTVESAFDPSYVPPTEGTVPEPSSFVLLVLALSMIGGLNRRWFGRFWWFDP